MTAVTTEYVIAVHEAGHALMAWSFGGRAIGIDLTRRFGLAHTGYDLAATLEYLPGGPLERALLFDAVKVTLSLAGPCAEGRIATPHGERGWTGDMREYAPLLQRISEHAGLAYDTVWDCLSGATNDLLRPPNVWDRVEEIAETALRDRIVSETTFASLVGPWEVSLVELGLALVRGTIVTQGVLRADIASSS